MMPIKPISRVLVALAMGGMMFGANATSISFDMEVYMPNPGEQVSVTVNFDFTDIATFGGGFNVIYDSNTLEFVSYTQAVFSGFVVGEPQQPGTPSPVGALDSPGNYLGAGVGTFDFAGIDTAGEVGTFVFNVLRSGGDGGCGATLCLTPNPESPFGSTVGDDLTDQTFAQGNSANVFPIDGDSVPPMSDNCTTVANQDQRDTDVDAIGNACDADINNDCIVNFLDLNFYRTNFFMPGDLDTDNNGDNITNFADLHVVRSQFFGPPGPSAAGCDAPTIYAIGDNGPGGGIVFHVTVGGRHGLEAAPMDQVSEQWCGSFADMPGVVNIGFGEDDSQTGAQNTAAIIDQCSTTNAAHVASDYVWPEGQTDGFLPNKQQLDLLFQQRSDVGGFGIGRYWSSSETINTPFFAWSLIFDDGSQESDGKLLLNGVRAVRAF